jgi:hypothetical protein
MREKRKKENEQNKNKNKLVYSFEKMFEESHQKKDKKKEEKRKSGREGLCLLNANTKKKKKKQNKKEFLLKSPSLFNERYASTLPISIHKLKSGKESVCTFEIFYLENFLQ